MQTVKISLVVATKDRPKDLERLLGSLAAQTERPFEVVIVDASREPVERVTREFPGLRIVYLRHWPPSASAQRNAGVRACSDEADLIGFSDDDTTYEPGAFEMMHRFWESAGSEVIGASFNIRNYELPGGQRLKRSRLVEMIGLYAPTPGSVARSGWQTVISEVHKTVDVQWLPTTSVVWRKDAIPVGGFDEFYDGYSYLEDLDFSYAVGRRGRLVVVADAGYRHFPSPAGRASERRFGYVEVRNRLYFVRKHGLSTPLCWLGLTLRFLMSAGRGRMKRCLGNLEGVRAALAGPDR